MKNDAIDNFCSTLREFTSTLEDCGKTFDTESRKTETSQQLDGLILETCENVLEAFAGNTESLKLNLRDMRSNAERNYREALRAIDDLERQARLHTLFLAIDLTTRVRAQHVSPDHVLDSGEPEFVHPCDLSESGILKHFGGVTDPDAFAAIVGSGAE